MDTHKNLHTFNTSVSSDKLNHSHHPQKANFKDFLFSFPVTYVFFLKFSTSPKHHKLNFKILIKHILKLILLKSFEKN